LNGYSGNLLITGSVSGAPYQNKMKSICDASVRETGMENRIVFTGFISEKELDSLFRMADFLIYPSLYEGFGIPVLEAMKMGLPVITSNTTAMPEVAGDAACLVDPTNIEEMTSVMSELLQNRQRQEEMIEKGLERARSYTWQNVSESYLKLYQEIIASV
jgi:glycosyltransferase involved in cell wall biosynthesis